MEGNLLRIGLVGCGRVAENHVFAVRKTSGAVLTAAAGGRNAEIFCRKYGLSYMTAEEIAESPEIDALLVCTPWKTHFAYAKRALCAGKHVLIEKPVSFEEEEIIDLQRLAEEHHVVCMPGHSYLYLPELNRMKRSVQEGSIGKPTYLYLSETYYMEPELFRKYEGPKIDVLCHQIYLSLAYLGCPTHISAFESSFDKTLIETGGPQIIVNMRYAGGCLAQILLSWAAEDATSDPWTFKVKLLGSGGGIHFSRRDFVRNTDSGYEQLCYQEMFDEQMDYFVNRCIRKGEKALSGMEDAVWVCRLHNLILKAADTLSVVIVEET